MTQWEETRRRPVLPWYLAALVWPVAALALPIYQPWALGATAVLSAAVGLAAARLCPARLVRRQVPCTTGDAEADRLLTDIAGRLDALGALNGAIPDPELSRQMDRMEAAGRAILEELRRAPDKAPQLDRFARYYLPEVIKILAMYARIEKEFADIGFEDKNKRAPFDTVVQGGIEGKNSQKILSEVRANAATMATAFENQLDSLYSAEAMDISTDIQVLDTILKSQNLAD